MEKNQISYQTYVLALVSLEYWSPNSGSRKARHSFDICHCVIEEFLRLFGISLVANSFLGVAGGK
jgi:hypothetical protein